MQTLPSLLSEIENCQACGLMAENNAIGIKYIPIKPKPNAKIVFIGRDPSPRTAVQVVGERGGRSVFINEVFKMVDEAGISEDLIYITDLCKCHWRTSVGKPLPHTGNRATRLDRDIADKCFQTWLVQEIRLLQPDLIVGSGEELYQLLRECIIYPSPAPRKFSATKDKSVLDAEAWFVENGPLSIQLDGVEYALATIRHAGNSVRLPRSSKPGDRRYEYHQKARKRLVELMSKAGS